MPPEHRFLLQIDANSIPHPASTTASVSSNESADENSTQLAVGVIFLRGGACNCLPSKLIGTGWQETEKIAQLSALQHKECSCYLFSVPDTSSFLMFPFVSTSRHTSSAPCIVNLFSDKFYKKMQWLVYYIRLALD